MATAITLRGDYFVAQIYSSTTIGTIKTSGLGAAAVHQVQSAFSEYLGVSGTTYDQATDTTTSNLRCLKSLNVNNWIDEVAVDVLLGGEVAETATATLVFHAAYSLPENGYIIAYKRAVLSRAATLTIPAGSILEFRGGGFKIGAVKLSDTLVLPMGLDIGKHIDSYSGTFAEGQVIYDSSLKKMKLWNGSEWTNVDGTALT